ncbi:MAG: TatD family hydrolase [Enterocloster bolteae]
MSGGTGCGGGSRVILERLMIETDAPYLTPLNIRGLSRRNVPSNIVYVAERIAEIKGVMGDREEDCLGNHQTFFQCGVPKEEQGMRKA